MIYAPPPAVVVLVDNNDDNGPTDPGYSVGTTMPGVEQYPAICGIQPLACALHYNPDSGTWTRQP